MLLGNLRTCDRVVDLHPRFKKLFDYILTHDLLDERRAAFLAYNSQTGTTVTARVRDAAEKADVVVVDLSETLPDGTDYLTWMGDIVDSLTRALEGVTPEDDGGH